MDKAAMSNSHIPVFFLKKVKRKWVDFLCPNAKNVGPRDNVGAAFTIYKFKSSVSVKINLIN